MSIFSFIPGGFLTKLAIYAIVATVTIGGLTATYFGWRHHQRMIGWNNALAKVEAVNAKAAEAAKKVTDTVDTCFDTGGSWNVETGKCDR